MVSRTLRSSFFARAHRWYRAPQRDGSHGPHVGWQIPRWDLAARGGDSVDGKPVRRHASHELIAPDAHSPIVERVRALRDEADVEHTAAIGCRHHNIVVCTAQAQVPPHSKSPAIPVGSPGRDGTYGKRRLLAAPVFRTVHPCDAALLPGIFPRTRTRHPTNIDRVQAYPKPPSLVISTRRATPRNIRPPVCDVRSRTPSVRPTWGLFSGCRPTSAAKCRVGGSS